MHISVDGGSICSLHAFGTTIFSSNLLKAISKYDKVNTYDVYTFCDQKGHILQNTKNMKFKKLLPVQGWMKARVSIEEFIKPKQLFLALNQALPLFYKNSAITFSHGLSFLNFPGLYRNDYDRLKGQLDDYVLKSKFIVVSSKKIKDELIGYDIDLSKKIVTIPFGIPFEFLQYKELKREKYFMFVGNNQPIKNVEFLIDVFKTFVKNKKCRNYKLYLVGPFEEYQSDAITVFKHCSRKELLTLYRKATAYLSASLYESFNLPILEAISQKCPVVALPSAVIPEFELYVTVAQDKQDFIEKISRLDNSKKDIDYSKLRNKFSWRNYVQKLHSLYNIL